MIYDVLCASNIHNGSGADRLVSALWCVIFANMGNDFMVSLYHIGFKVRIPLTTFMQEWHFWWVIIMERPVEVIIRLLE